MVRGAKPAAKRGDNDILEQGRELVAHQDLGMGLQAVGQRRGRGGGVVLELHGIERRTYCVGVGERVERQIAKICRTKRPHLCHG